MSWRVPVARPDVGAEEAAAVHAVVSRGWITQGPEVRALEAEFARFCGTRRAVATSSGTDALTVTMLALGIGPGDEVITTPLSCIASANAILFTGARPVFVDVEPETYNLDPGQVQKHIGPRTRLVLPVHLFGHPVDLDALLEIGRAHGLDVVEDASQAAGAEHRGRKVGSVGRAGVFSLYANKLFTTGEGGLVSTNDAPLADRMVAIRNFGQIPGVPFAHPYLGGNHKLTDVCAAIGRVQLGKVPGYVERRRRHAADLAARLAGLDGLIERLPTEHAWARAVPFSFHMLFRTGALRDRAETALHEAGVETRPFFSVISVEPPYRALGFDADSTPVAADVFARGLYVSCSPDLTAEDRALIADTLAGVARAAGVA